MLIIVVLLACMAVFIVANATALAVLKSQIQLIDQQQRQKYGQSPRH